MSCATRNLTPGSVLRMRALAEPQSEAGPPNAAEAASTGERVRGVCHRIRAVLG